jgi:6-phosphogluconolactonase
LTFLNKQPTGGGGSAYVSTDALGKYVFSASYGGGSLSALPIQPDGSLGADVQIIKHEGGSVDTARQTKSYVHSIVVSPDNRYVITADLGTDKMNIYSFDPKKSPSPLAPGAQPFVILGPGSGPRHSTFHPDKKFYYVVSELNTKIDAFNYKDGQLTHIQTVGMLRDGYTGKGDAADIHVSPDGKFLYANARSEVNEVVIFSIDQKAGKLTFIGRQSSLGKGSRTFDIDPTGNFMVLTNQATNTVVIFKRNQKTGLLTPTGQQIDVSRPSMVKFVWID